MSLLRQLNSSGAAMEMITTIFWVVATISFIVFIALFGRLPIFRRTPIGWTHKLLLQIIPNALIKIDDLLTGRRITRNILRTYDYLMHDRHPVVMIIFIILQAGSELLFIPPATPFLPPYQTYLVIPILVALPYITLYLSYTTSTHHITPHSYATALTRYPYDYTLYHPHLPCRTCQTPKPARSKHCPICKTCIERQDHHCIWINNCVGLHNYPFFIALLLSISSLLAYGTITGFRILDLIIQNTLVPPELTRGSLTTKRWSTTLPWTDYLNAYAIVIASNPRLGAVTLLTSMTWPLALGFLLYHIYLTWAGTTTNETAKWSDLKEDITDHLVWKARIDDVRNEYPGPLDERIVYDAGHHVDQTRRNGRLPRWGKRVEWWVIRTRGGAQPMRETKNRKGQEVDGRWGRVRGLDEVDNVYDLGVVGNIRDLIVRPFRAG